MYEGEIILQFVSEDGVNKAKVTIPGDDGLFRKLVGEMLKGR